MALEQVTIRGYVYTRGRRNSHMMIHMHTQCGKGWTDPWLWCVYLYIWVFVV